MVAYLLAISQKSINERIASCSQQNFSKWKIITLKYKAENQNAMHFLLFENLSTLFRVYSKHTVQSQSKL